MHYTLSKYKPCILNSFALEKLIKYMKVNFIQKCIHSKVLLLKLMNKGGSASKYKQNPLQD